MTDFPQDEVCKTKNITQERLKDSQEAIDSLHNTILKNPEKVDIILTIGSSDEKHLIKGLKVNFVPEGDINLQELVNELKSRHFPIKKG